MSEHTALPWFSGPEGEIEEGMTAIHSKEHGALALVVTRMSDYDPGSPKDRKEKLKLEGNVRLLVKAVNYHDRLVEALDKMHAIAEFRESRNPDVIAAGNLLAELDAQK